MKLSLQETHAIDARRQYKDLPEFFSEYESPFESDYDRLIHSPTFRRLQGKRQMVPIGESDFFRNRLSHSVELPCYARQIATRIKQMYPDKCDINMEVLNFACLAHDLGHPPFGHLGDKILTKMMEDAGGYEGNAQTFRLLTTIEKGLINDRRSKVARNRMGLNLTNRSLLSILKYNWILGENPDYPIKGYFSDDDAMIRNLWRQYGVEIVDIPFSERPRSIECEIMDLADDITNSVMDLEDNLKRGVLNMFDMFFPNDKIIDILISEVFGKKYPQLSDIEKRSMLFSSLNQIFDETDILPIREDRSRWMKIIGIVYRKANLLASDGFERSRFVRRLINSFIEGVEYEPNEDCLMLSRVRFTMEVQLQVDILKSLQNIFDHNAAVTKEGDYRGFRFIRKMYDVYHDDVRMLPDDIKEWYYSTSNIQGLTFHLERIGRADLLGCMDSLKTVAGSQRGEGEIHSDELIMGKGDKAVNINDIYSIQDFRNLEVEPHEEPFREIIYKFRKRIICDHIACMTDAYCKATFKRLFVPAVPQ